MLFCDICFLHFQAMVCLTKIRIKIKIIQNMVKAVKRRVHYRSFYREPGCCEREMHSIMEDGLGASYRHNIRVARLRRVRPLKRRTISRKVVVDEVSIVR